MGVLDRFGEPIADEVDDEIHDPHCDGGWLGEDEHGAMIPCYRCRPWLKDRHLRRRTVALKRKGRR